MQELLLRTAEQRRRGILGANTMGKRLRALAELYKSCDEDRGEGPLGADCQAGAERVAACSRKVLALAF